MLTLEGRIALVTGGSRGIGRAVCVLFARLGAKVCVNYVRDEAAAQETVALIQKAGGVAIACRADVSRFEEAGRLVAETDAHLRRPRPASWPITASGSAPPSKR